MTLECSVCSIDLCLIYFDENYGRIYFLNLQLKHAASHHKQQNYGAPKVTVEELKNWFDENKHIPENDDVAFIPAARFQNIISPPNAQQYVPDKMKFKALVTTKRLIKNAMDKSIIHADATYKLNREGYPLLVFGCSDKQRAFHVIAVAICDSETTEDYAFCFKEIENTAFRVLGQNVKFEVLVSDAAPAIKNGFDEVYPERETVTCYFHMKKRIDTFNQFKKKENKESIVRDIGKLQISPSRCAFEAATKLFEKKWIRKEKPFVEYFLQNWVKKNNDWFEGVRHFTPSTNNSLESFNDKLKRDFDFRGRPSFNQFKVKVFQIMHLLSCEYRDEVKSFKLEPKIDHAMWTKGMEWALSDANSIEGEDGEHVIYYIPGDAVDKIDDSDVEEYLRGSTFDELVNRMFSVLKICVYNKTQITCTCCNFFKLYMCKHALGMGIRLKIYTPPDAINAVLNNIAKNKRGRPKKARSALERM